MIKCALTLQSYVRTGGMNQSQFVLHAVMTCYYNDITAHYDVATQHKVIDCCDVTDSYDDATVDQDTTVRYDVTAFFLLNLLNLASWLQCT